MTAKQMSNIEKSVGPAMARFFSPGVLRELAQKGHSVIAGRLAKQYNLFEQYGSRITVAEFYNGLFERLIKEYRHEYIYKNAIAENILLGRHNLNTAFMLTEFRADNCIADAVVINGTTHAYEIKSEMDSFERLDRQIAAYKKLFDCIWVVTTERLYDAVKERVCSGIGIMVLAEGGYNFRKNPRLKPVSNKENVDPVAIFKSLQQAEYLRIIKKELDVSLTHLPNTKIYSEAKSYFSTLSPIVAHDQMVEELTLRKYTHNITEFITSVPKSLKASALSIKFTKKERHQFCNILQKDIASAFKYQ